MSTLPTNPVDDLVRRTRKKAVPAQVEQRAVPRASIEELNATDLDTIRERFAASRYDDRGPVVRFLDLIDAPRNQLLATLAPGLERKSREKGETAAFGTGRVNFSDVLGEMGMDPGIARGVLGFIGDIATDPLTYAGPPGWGAKTASASGRALHITGGLGGGIRALKAAEKGAGTGAAKELADVVGKNEGLRTAVLGGFKAGTTRTQRVGKTVGRVLGEPKEFEGGLLGKYADEVTRVDDAAEARAIAEPRMRATDRFLKDYGKGQGPSLIRIGRKADGKLGVEFMVGRGKSKIPGATSSLAHVPFSDISLLSVPAFTAEAKSAATQAARAATTAERIGVTAAQTAKTAAQMTGVGVLNQSVQALKNLVSDETKFRAQYADDIARLDNEPVPVNTGLFAGDAPPTPEAARLNSVRDRLRGFEEQKAKMAEQIKKLGDDIQTRMADVESGTRAYSPGELLALRRDADQYEAIAGSMLEQVAVSGPLAMARGALKVDEAKRDTGTMGFVERLAGHDATDSAGSRDAYSASSFLGIDPATGRTAINSDLNVIGDVSERIRPKLDEYDEALDDVASLERNAGQPTEAQISRGLTPDAIHTRLVTLRKELMADTAPLRTGSLAEPDAVREVIRNKDRAMLTDTERQLLDMSDTDAANHQLIVDALQKAVTANIDAAWSLRTSAVQLMTPEQKRFLQLQKDFLGTHDPIVGAASMGAVRSITDAIFGGDNAAAFSFRNRVEAKMRTLFGGDTGAVGDAVRFAQHQAGEGGRTAATADMLNIMQDVRKLAAKHGMEHKEGDLLTLSLAAAIYQREKASGRMVYRTTDPFTGEYTGFWKTLNDAFNKGVLKKDFSDPLGKDIMEFARTHPQVLDDMRDIAEARGFGGAARAAYFPNVVTSKGKEFIGRVGRSGGETGALASARLRGAEAFQKARTHDSVAFESKRLGRTVELFNSDRWVQTLSDQEVAAIGNTKSRAAIEELRAALDEYDAMPDRPPMLANDPLRMNELLRNGRFHALLGTDKVPGGFMDTNMATAIAGRRYQHERAMATDMFQKEVIPSVTLPIKAGALSGKANMPIGSTIDLGNGLTGQLIRLGGKDGDMAAVKVGDDIFRPLRSDVRKNTKNLLMEAIGESGREALYHSNAADVIEAASKTFEPEGREFWDGLDKLTAAWKTITLMHPSWWIGNVIGESINFSAQDPHFMVAMAKYAKAVAQMFRSIRDPERLAKITLDVGGEKITGRDVMEAIRESSVVDRTLFQEPAQRAIQDMTLMPSRMEKWSKSFGRSALSSDLQSRLDIHATALGSGDFRAKVNAAADVASDRWDRWLKAPWYKANTVTSNMLRTLAYLSLRDQGSNHANSVARMLRAGFDYSNMTPFERTWGRRLFPFWAWMKNNSVYQAKLLMERPIFIGAFPSLQRGIEEALDGEDRIPVHARPKWMQEQLAVQIGGEDAKRYGLLLGNLLPIEQGLLLGRLIPGVGSVQSAANYAASSLNPVFRFPLEVGAGREFFSDRTIAGDQTEGDVSLLQHAANQIRPLREIPKLTKTFKEQGVGAGVARALIGGRAQPMSDDRIKTARLREFQEKEARLRTSLRRADKAGDVGGRSEANLRLLLLYRAMSEAGLSADVPKWARERIASLSPAE